MERNYFALAAILASLFVIGMGIFLLWKVLEPKCGGESRSVVELVVKPAAVMVGGVIFIGLSMIDPPILVWTLVVWAIFAVVTYFQVPSSQNASVAKAATKPDLAMLWSIARLILAVILVFATVAGILVVSAHL